MKLEEEWCRANNCEEQLALGAERKSMTYALNHMEALGLTGGVLHVNGKIAAFTYGAPINHETWDTCVEKADTGIEGSYAMINYEYANHIDEQYIYVKPRGRPWSGRFAQSKTFLSARYFTREMYSRAQ